MSDGVIIADRSILGDGVVMGDGTVMADGTVMSDSTKALAALLFGDATASMATVVDNGVVNANY